MADRHGWNQRDNYFHIHYRVLRFYEPYMQHTVQYKHEVITPNFEILQTPKIILTTSRSNIVHVNIKKDIQVRRTLGARAEAKTYAYRYHANRPDGRALVRYYQSCKAQYSIGEAKLLKGKMPNKADQLICEWIRLRKEELTKDWDLAKEGKPVYPVSPLE